MMLRRRGLVFKQCFFVLLAVGLVFAGVVFFMSWKVRLSLLSDIRERSLNLAQSSANEIDQVFFEVQRTAKMLALLAADPQFSDEMLQETLKRAIRELHREREQVFGGSFAFEPYMRSPERRYCMWYVSLDGEGKVRFETAGGPDYEYFMLKWYEVPKLLEQPVWSEPYIDTGLGEIAMTTYSVPIYREDAAGERRFAGVVTIDVSLDWLRESIGKLQFNQVGYAFLMSRFGRIVSHPLPEIVMNETFFSLAPLDDRKFRELGRRMLSGEQGFARDYYPVMKTEGDSYLCYVPLSSNRWVLVLVFPSRVLFGTLNLMQWTTVGLGLAGIGLILLLVIYITRRELRPLRQLATAAERIGAGDLQTKLPEIVSGDEIGMLGGAFVQMRQALQNYIAELQETTSAKEKIESELKIARSIQNWILPQLREIGRSGRRMDLHAELFAARSVGGDLYDFFWLNDNKLCFAIGDVAGKGVPAALFMAVTQTLHRGIASELLSSGEIVSRVNASLAQNNELMMFVTYFLGILDVATGRLEYTNAGHNPPYRLAADGRQWRLDKLHGPPMGIGEQQYGSDVLQLSPGDCLVLYTDGVTEALNPNRDCFGEQRLRQVLAGGSHHNRPQAVINAILASVDAYAAGAEQADDITMLAIRYAGGREERADE